MRTVAITLLLLCGCGGGGGGGSPPPAQRITLTPPFQPVSPIINDYDWLIGTWVCRARSDKGGPDEAVQVSIGYSPQSTPDDRFEVSISSLPLGGQFGSFVANGSRAHLTAYFGSIRSTAMLLDLPADRISPTGRYEVYQNAISTEDPFDSGSIEFTRNLSAPLPSSLTITETYTEPGFSLQVVTKVR